MTAVALLLVFLNFTLHLGFGIGGWIPDLSMLALLILAREAGPGSSAATGFLLGVLEDSFSLLAFGAGAISLTITGALAAQSRRIFMGDSAAFVVTYFATGLLLRALLHVGAAAPGVAAIGFGTGGAAGIGEFLLRTAGGVALGTGIVLSGGRRPGTSPLR